jgi:endonuclease/exonuclease/phosphatase family metal-dependent hydrolase
MASSERIVADVVEAAEDAGALDADDAEVDVDLGRFLRGTTSMVADRGGPSHHRWSRPCEPLPMTLRVMTWNLWWRFGDWERRAPAIVEVLRAHDPDIVCLQEVWASRDGSGSVTDQAEVLAEALGRCAVSTEYSWYDGLSFDNAILSRWPVEVVADEPLPGADGAPGHRRALVARVASPWGSWPVLSTHLEYRFDASATRTLQLRRVMELVVEHRGDPEHDLPVVVGGDLNAVPDSDEIRMATGRTPGAPPGVLLSDVWEHVGEGPGITWDRRNPDVAASAWPDRRIDQLMVSWPRPKPVGNPASAWLAADRPVEIEGEPVWASDHVAVVAELHTPS